MSDDTKILKQKLNAWKRLAIARGKILTAYRIGGRPVAKALDEALAASTKLRELGEEKA